MCPGSTVRAWRGGAASVDGILSALGKVLRPVVFLLLLAILATLLTHYLTPSNDAAGGDSFYGMVVGPQVDVDQAIPKLGTLGVNTVRLQTSVKDWSHPAANTGADQYDGALQQAPKLDGQGLPGRAAGRQRGRRDAVVRPGQGILHLADGPARASSVNVVEVFGPVTVRASNADAMSTTLTRAQQATAVRRRPAQGGLGGRARRPPQEGARGRVHAVPAGGGRALDRLVQPRRHPGVRAGRLPGPGRLRRLPPGPDHAGDSRSSGCSGPRRCWPASRCGSRSGS